MLPRRAEARTSRTLDRLTTGIFQKIHKIPEISAAVNRFPLFSRKSHRLPNEKSMQHGRRMTDRADPATELPPFPGPLGRQSVHRAHRVGQTLHRGGSGHAPRKPAVQNKAARPPLSGRTGRYNLATTYSRMTCRQTTIGAAAFHFRVRDGNGWFHRAMVTRSGAQGPERIPAGAALAETLMAGCWQAVHRRTASGEWMMSGELQQETFFPVRGRSPPRRGRRVRLTAVCTAAGSLISAYRRKYVNE